MSHEINTVTMEPVRHTFTSIEQRFGNKPANRYQEATYDLQPYTNFHYKPTWQPQYNLNDAARTKVVMSDWYDLKDPRQFYYGTYVAQRAKMQEAAENNYSFFDSRNLNERISTDIQEKVIRLMVPLRHVEHAANLNNMSGCAYGFGTAITQGMVYAAMDRLGIAQYLSRIGLLLDGNTGAALEKAKDYWMSDAVWQPMRALCEETLVTEDWFELFVAQDLVMDSLIYNLYFDQFDAWLNENGGHDIGMLTQFMRDWSKDYNRWLETIVKTAVSESDTNKAIISEWVEKWKEKTVAALKPLAEELIDAQALETAIAALDKRLKKVGLV